jgi:hypothetical protein
MGLSKLEEQGPDHLHLKRRHVVPPNIPYPYNRQHGVHNLEDLSLNLILVTATEEAPLYIPYRELQLSQL